MSRTGAAAAVFSYVNTGKLNTEAANGLTCTYFYDGKLLKEIDTAGLFAYKIVFTYDNFLNLHSQTINTSGTTGTEYDYAYDNDQIITGLGPASGVGITVTRDPGNGLLVSTAVGTVGDSYGTPNTFGELMTYTAGSGGSIYSETLERGTANVGARITKKTETVGGGTPTVWSYDYDSSNRLWHLYNQGGATQATYAYDSDGNRTTDLGLTYDGQDRITSTGYTWTKDGRMSASPAGTNPAESYVYDALGNLNFVTVGGVQYTYLVDAQNRRVRKFVTSSGVVKQQFLYGQGPNPIAELDGSGNIVSMFYYATGRNVPDYMVKPGSGGTTTTYKLITDHLGSVRVVYNLTTSNADEVITYDPWGDILSDTASTRLMPFGFAGGIYDSDTKLVRFGARDYNPAIGRWMSKDQTRFDGGLNFYVYGEDDPVNRTDPSGNGPADFFSCLIGGGGFLDCLAQEESRIWRGPNGTGANGDGFGGAVVPPTDPAPSLGFPECSNLGIWETQACCQATCDYDPSNPDAPVSCPGQSSIYRGQPKEARRACLQRCYDAFKLPVFPVP